MSLGRGPCAGGLGGGRRRASDHQPWLLSWRGNGGSERGSHLPKVTRQGDVGRLALQAYFSASENAEPSTAKDKGVCTRMGSQPPKATTSWSSRIPEGPSPLCLTRDQPVTVLPDCPGSQPEPLRCLEKSQELKKPRDAGLETSCFFWAESLLFIAVWGWRRVLPAPPVTGVFGGDEPAPENPLREQLYSPGRGGAKFSLPIRTLSSLGWARLRPLSSAPSLPPGAASLLSVQRPAINNPLPAEGSGHRRKYLPQSMLRPALLGDLRKERRGLRAQGI